ncbi:MAG: carboxypeptidase regulatory-like domain-containing protein [Terracidiphilus sp.]|jgi:hypothetical protein
MILIGFQGVPASAQQLTGSLSGIVVDQMGARIPDAKVELRNEASGDARATVCDKEGYFNIAAIQPATYSLFVSASGFTKWQAKGIVINLGDQRSIPSITLKVSANANETVTVVSGEDVTVPLDTAEISETLNEKMISDLPIGGRNAGELMKIMPGFARTSNGNGLSQTAAFNSTGAVQSNSGPVGDFSANGTQPNGTMAFMLDGSNLLDPGNMGTQIANINQDMVSEVKVLTSSYSAEYAKGPVVFQAFSKTGGNHYHGEGYMYARNNALESWDWYTKQSYLEALAAAPGTGSALAATLRPDEKYYYMGGNVGGPILLPFTSFNKNHDKLFFWVGYEYMDQHPAAAPVLMDVPTTDELNGNFSFSDINPQLLNSLQNSSNSQLYHVLYSSPDPNGTTSVRPAYWDPNIKGLIAENAYPAPNVTPSANNSWNNYDYAASNPLNRYEVTGKVTYAFSENTKLNASYTRQVEKDYHPLSIWWAPQWTVPYPSPVTATPVGNFVMGNLTHVFNPTTTNEFVYNYSRWINPSTLTNPAAVDRTALNFNVPHLFGGKSANNQIPNIEGPWGGALSNISEEAFYDGFDGGKGFGGIKLGWAFYDNFTKNVGTHSMKAGFYWDYEGNQQSGGNANNGTYNLGWGGGSTGNVVADMLIGSVSNYQESSTDPTSQVGFHQWSMYAQDSWKVNKQLTLNYGLRFDHEGQWSGGVADGNFWLGGPGNNNLGFQVWDPASFVNAAPGTAPGNTGLKWHAIDSSIPLSGFPSKFLTVNPRLGFAYDILGDGKTVLRGGYSVFQYQISTQANNAWGGPQGAFTYQTPGGPNMVGGVNKGYAGIATITPPGGSTQNGSKIFMMQQGDNKNPYTADWNVTISRSMPWRSVAEVSYVANKSRDLYADGSNSGIGDQNLVQPGTVFLPDPTETGQIYNPTNGTLNGLKPNPPIANGVAFDGRRTPAGPNCTINSTTTASSAGNSTYCAADETHYSSALPGWTNLDWAPYQTYQQMLLMNHSGYANYNSLQASWQKQSGQVLWVTNYTFSKAMGIWDYVSENGNNSGPNVDTFNLKDNYGPLSYDHSQIINLTYIWNMANYVKNGNVIVRQAVNGWQLSGITGFQSGPPLQPNTGGNLNASFPSSLSVPYNDVPLAPDYSIPLPNGLRSVNMNQATWFGTGSQRILLPNVICDPRKGLQKGQYFNTACFAPPAYGQQGTLEWPYIKGPAYFDSDLALYKSFKITENQSVQFRVSSTNFLNHPLREFNAAGGNADVQLNFAQNLTKTQVPTNTPNYNLQAISQTNTNTATTGTPTAKVGNRSTLFSVKYLF